MNLNSEGFQWLLIGFAIAYSMLDRWAIDRKYDRLREQIRERTCLVRAVFVGGPMNGKDVEDADLLNLAEKISIPTIQQERVGTVGTPKFGQITYQLRRPIEQLPLIYDVESEVEQRITRVTITNYGTHVISDAPSFLGTCGLCGLSRHEWKTTRCPEWKES